MTDPLEQAILDLHEQLERATELAVKHCAMDHPDRDEVAELYVSAAIDRLRLEGQQRGELK